MSITHIDSVKDNALDSLYDCINDIQEGGVIPERIFILTPDMYYTCGMSNDDVIAALQKMIIALTLEDLQDF